MFKGDLISTTVFKMNITVQPEIPILGMLPMARACGDVCRDTPWGNNAVKGWEPRDAYRNRAGRLRDGRRQSLAVCGLEKAPASHQQIQVSLQDLLLSGKKKVQRMEKAINYVSNKTRNCICRDWWKKKVLLFFFETF